MKIRVLCLALAGVLSGCDTVAPTSVAEIQRPAVGQCAAGNCSNGYGTLQYPDGSAITGPMAGGKPSGGEYQIKYACVPDKTFTVVMDATLHYIRGTVARCGNLLGMLESGARTTYFTGTFELIDNPFTHEQISTYKTGTYTDGDGVKWDGEFSYIPDRNVIDSAQWGRVATRKGSFVFVGSKIDEENNEVVSGLYVSAPVSPGSEIQLTRAREDYLAQLRAKYVAAQEQDAAERAEDARASQAFFSTMVTLVNVAASTYVSYKTNELNNRHMLDTLNRGLTNRKLPAQADLPRSTGKTAAPAQTKPLTVAQYRNWQSKGGANVQTANDKTAGHKTAALAPAPAARQAVAATPPAATSVNSRANPAQAASGNWIAPTGAAMSWHAADRYCKSKGGQLPSLNEIRNLYLSGGTNGWSSKGDTWTRDREGGDSTVSFYAYETNGNGYGIGYENAQGFADNSYLVACVR